MAERYQAELLSKREVIPGTYHFVLRAHRIAAAARPGQFVMVQVQDGTDPLLRRPISLCAAAEGNIELLFQVKGRGTGLLAAREPGCAIDILGPLGNGFAVPTDMHAAVLVAGGIGAAPLLFLAKYLIEIPGIKRQFYFGTKTGNELPIVQELLISKDFEFFFVSEAGSTEFKGFVTSIFDRNLKLNKIAMGSHVFSCGPEPMLRKISEIVEKHGLKCQVSLEARMACGVGACLGCAVATQAGYRRVCADGPVFESRDLRWVHD